MRYHYVWLWWSSAFLAPWIVLYLANPLLRAVMWRTSLATSAFGLTEPIFVPQYWNPPSLFELAQRTRFDIESVIFSFAIGGAGVVLYNAVTHSHLAPVSAAARGEPLHRFHRAALVVPAIAFGPLVLLPWNSIYAAITALILGSAASVACRPRLLMNALVGGALFLGFYSAFMLGLAWSAPGYIAQVWNLPALSGVLIYDIPIEEFLFAVAFGLYWSGVYEHYTWTEGMSHTGDGDRFLTGRSLRTRDAHDPSADSSAESR